MLKKYIISLFVIKNNSRAYKKIAIRCRKFVLSNNQWMFNYSHWNLYDIIIRIIWIKYKLWELSFSHFKSNMLIELMEYYIR